MPFRDDDLPLIYFDPTRVSQAEGGYVTFTVMLSEAQMQDVTVDYATVAGSATTETDYNGIAGPTLTFAAGETSKTIDVYVYDDDDSETDESYFLELFNPVGATFGEQNHSLKATGWILDNDAGGGQRALAVAAPLVVEEEDGVATFTVSLSQAFDEETTLTYETVSGSALAGQDFEAASGSLIFSAGQTEATVAVTLLDDGLAEATESFGLKVTGGGLATLSQATLFDDDSSLPVVSVKGGAAEEGGYVTFELQLSAPSTSDVTVDYETIAGTAIADTDFNATSGSVTFEAGETTKIVSIYTYDTLTPAEPDETFFLRLSDPVGATFGPGDKAPQTTQWILDEDPGAEKRALTVTGVTADEASQGKAGKATFTIAISRALDTDLTLTYATKDGTAKAGSDYVAATGSVTIHAGATEAQVTVDLLGDTAAELAETFTLSVSGIPADDFAPSGGIVSKATAKILDNTLKGTSGADVLLGTGGADRIEAGAGSDRLSGLNANDRLYGGAGSDKVYGGNGHDRGYGGTGTDTVAGGKGNDQLFGGAGNDKLYGGDGNDRLYGDAGADRLYGGAGNDTFIFSKTSASPAGKGRDRIYGFDRDDDLIDLSGIDANTGKKGNQAFDFIGSKQYSDTAGELRISGKLIAGDVDGDGKSDFSIELASLSKLNANDFIL